VPTYFQQNKAAKQKYKYLTETIQTLIGCCPPSKLIGFRVQQNKAAKQKNKYLTETIQTLLGCCPPSKLIGWCCPPSKLPRHLLDGVVLSVNYFINHMPSSVPNDYAPHSPFDTLSPSVFGSTCFVHNLALA